MVGPSGPISLAQLPVGRRATVEAIRGGRRMVSALASMGIVRGTVLTVLGNAGGGPVIVEVRGSRLALGRGQAGRIAVRPISGA